MTAPLVVGAHPPRIDLEVHAGEPVDFTVPVLDEDDVPVASLTGWTPAAQIRAGSDGPLLATLTTAVTGSSVQITATGDVTAVWAFSAARWDLVITSPAGIPHPLCGGWVRLYPTITHA